MSSHGLPEKRLATTDEVGKRVYIHPHDTHGKWTSFRKKLYLFLLGIYLILPWIYINGKQIILLDLPAREFYIFGTTFYGHDAPLLVFILLGFVFFISYITSVYGRVWCGHACPQTVFIDLLYRQVERWIEGTGPKRDKLQAAPWNIEKVWKRSLKWFLYIIISLHIAHSGIGYFVGTHNLLEISMHSPFENFTLFTTMLVVTGILLLDFGWFREQFCIIACPYGRFQSIAMDESSLIVAYDEKRGEPRKRSTEYSSSSGGDCVACNKCVQVCPTGIDIRDGLQMECIACTMCIDACDDIMRRVKKPEGLIRYTTENELDNKPNKRSPRVYIYLILSIVCAVGLFFSISTRGNLKLQLLRGSQVPYQVVQMKNSEDKIVNHYNLKIHYNKTVDLDLKVGESEIEVLIPEHPIKVKSDNTTATIFFKFKQNILVQGEKKIDVDLYNIKTKKVLKSFEVNLVGPIR